MVVENPRFDVGNNLDASKWSVLEVTLGGGGSGSARRCDRPFECLAKLRRIRVSCLVPLKCMPHVRLFV